MDIAARYRIDEQLIGMEGIRRPVNESVVDFNEPPFDPMADDDR